MRPVNSHADDTGTARQSVIVGPVQTTHPLPESRRMIGGRRAP